ncbi:hypothetical protein F4054_21610 [Candidatus Poribacteria bacterium]|nr:hypothetical protein [Candidatus Poribacteria bacterium]MYG07580.1 hypothetical protein [Candidatus Poribacteria bacterium]MYK24845.1 hypothetical protein [Candidatus Poribacteria bacterium]
MASKAYSLSVCVAIGVCLLIVGCAPLPRRIAATHLSCETYPKLVDGDLATNSFLKVKGFIEKDNPAYRHSLRYGDWVEGKHKTEALIQVDTLTHVAYLEVHPISTIYHLSVETSTAETAQGKARLFEPVTSHKIARSENGAVIRIDIDRPVRMLRVAIHVNRDLARTTREPLTRKTKVSFEDVVIREIRVYQ